MMVGHRVLPNTALEPTMTRLAVLFMSFGFVHFTPLVALAYGHRGSALDR